jgi:TP901 family phage tail tape measure protein
MAATLTIPTIFTAVDKFTSTITKMGGSMDKFQSKAARHYAMLGRSARAIGDRAKSISMSTAVGALAIAAPLIYAGKAAVGFEKNMSNVSTLVDTAKESMTSMGADVLRIYRVVPVQIEDLTKGLYQVRSAGIGAALAMDVLKNSAWLSVAGLSTVEQSTNVLTSAINVFKDQNMSAQQIAGNLFETVKRGKTTMAGLSEAFGATAPIVHSAGVSLQDYLAAVAAITVSGSPAAQAMNEIRASVVALNKPTKDMEKVYASLGVKGMNPIKKLLARYHDLGDVFKVVDDRGAKLHINMAKAWGRVQASVAATLVGGISLKDYHGNMAGMANGVKDFLAAQGKQAATAAAHMQLLKNNAQALAISLGTKMLPMLNRIADKMVPVIGRMLDWIDKHPKLTKVILEGAVALSAFLGTVSLVSGIVWGVTKAIEAYAAINGLLATSGISAAAGIGVETVAMGALETATALANVGLVTLLGTMGLVAAAVGGLGYVMYKDNETIQGIEHGQALARQTKAWRSAHPNANILAGNASSNVFLNNLKAAPGFKPDSLQKYAAQIGSGQMSLTQFGSLLNNKNNPQAQVAPAYVAPAITRSHGEAQSSKVDITLNDPGNSVKEVKSNSPHTQVKVTPTSGQR